jgi:hypothetical protein
MKKNNTQAPNTETDKKENPPYYEIDHGLAVLIWEVLLAEGWSDLERILSGTMIEQGCQGIENKDWGIRLAFWKDYLEENDLACFATEDELH